jgi:hypothetical protein
MFENQWRAADTRPFKNRLRNAAHHCHWERSDPPRRVFVNSAEYMAVLLTADRFAICSKLADLRPPSTNNPNAVSSIAARLGLRGRPLSAKKKPNFVRAWRKRTVKRIARTVAPTSANHVGASVLSVSDIDAVNYDAILYRIWRQTLSMVALRAIQRRRASEALSSSSLAVLDERRSQSKNRGLSRL